MPVLVAASLGGLVGVAWSVLYDTGLGDGTRVAFAHALAGGIAGATTLPFPRRLRASIGVGWAVALGAALGAVWVAPAVLFLLDSRFLDIRVDAAGLAIVLLVGSMAMALGAAAVGRAARAGRAPGLLSALFLALVVAALSALGFGGSLGPRIGVLNRIAREPIRLPEGVAPRVMVLGIDGGSWNVLVPLLKAGKLPHLRSLMEKGRYGILESVLSTSGDTASPVVWTSIFTGTRPDHHGIRDWEDADSRNRRRKALWNILNDQGRRAIVVNVPGTFPPEVVEGAMVSGFPIPGVARPFSTRLSLSTGRVYSTHPEEFRVVPAIQLTPSERGPRREPPASFSTPLEVELPIAERLVRQYGKLRRRSYGLGLGNLFLELADRRGYFGARVVERYVGALVDTVDDGETDYDELHLFRAGDERSPFAVLSEGEWTDWLSVRYGEAALALKLRANAISKDRVDLYATPLFQSSADPVIPFTYPKALLPGLSSGPGQYVVEGAGWVMFEDEPLIDALYEHVADVGRQHVQASTALLDAVPDWSLFVHVFTESDRIQHSLWRFHEPESYEEIDAELVSRHGGKVASTLEAIDAQIGRLLARADERTLVAVFSDHGFEAGRAEGRGEHSMDGIYVFSGPGVGASGPDLELDELPRASVLDLTPTLLCLSGYPLARDLDGRALTEIAGETPWPCRDTEPVGTYETGSVDGGGDRALDETTIEQLRSLGYVR